MTTAISRSIIVYARLICAGLVLAFSAVAPFYGEDRYGDNAQHGDYFEVNDI